MATSSAAPATPPRSNDPPSLRSPILLSTRSPAPRPASVLIQNVRGAEGGVEAITARRRNSGSFKTMSTGGLVSNSPFAKRLGQTSPTKTAGPSPTTTATSSGGLYASSRIPTATASGAAGGVRRSSGSRKASGDHEDGPVKENSQPSELNELANGAKFDDRSRSSSPAVPFRPVRQQQSTTTAPLSSLPFKPSHPASDDASQPRRQTSSYAHLRKNNLVSSSPFTSQQQQQQHDAPSPELQQVPYEIGALTLESAPMEFFHEDEATDRSPQLGLGARPGQGALGPAVAQRHAAGASMPPPVSPPSTGVTTSSAMAPVRRGMRGPRPLSGDGLADAAEQSRTVRRQPSSKSVAWAETEEVFEFEVEEERRRSMMSDASTLSDEGRYYGRGEGEDDDEDSSFEDDNDDRRLDGYGAQHASYSFEEGGSVEVHDLDGDAGSDAEESVVSNTSSAMDEVIGQIDSYLHEEESYEADVFSPSQIPHHGDGGAFDDQPDLPTHHDTSGYSSPQIAQHQHMAGPMSAFSVSTASGVGSANDDGASDVMSTSAYGDDDQDDEAQAHFDATRQTILAREFAATPMSPPRPPLPPRPAAAAAAPSSRAPATDPISAAVLAPSDSQFSLPDIPGTSPFVGFEDDGTAGSVVSLASGAQPRAADSIPATRPLSLHAHSTTTSTPVKAAGRVDPDESTPTKSTPTAGLGLAPSSSADSPILSAMHRSPDAPGAAALVAPGSASPALSRKASLVGSDVTTSSTSWYVSSLSGSLRGGRLGGGLENAMKRHEHLLASPSIGGGGAFGAFPSASSRTSSIMAASPARSSSMMGSPGKSTPPTSHASSTLGSDVVAPLSLKNTLSASSAKRAIEARPALKAHGATVSSGMMPTIAASAQRAQLGVSVGSPLTARVAEEMQSPLERLQMGVKGRGEEGAEWRCGDSLLGAEGEEGDEAETGDEVGSLRPGSGAPPTKRLQRRRSRSTGDADLAETTSSIAMQAQHTMPELGFEQQRGTDDDAAFGSSVLESLDDIYNSRNRTYRVRESKRLVVVSDIAGSKAGDVDPGRAWRKKRPSNVHEINRSLSTMSVNSQAVRKNREFAGQLFVLIREASFEGMPMPRSKVMVTAALDNGRQRVDVASRELSNKVSLRKEFELVCNQDLAFSIHFSVPRQTPTTTPVAPAVPFTPAPTPPASPSKAHRAFRIFSSPKKKAAPPVRPVPTPAAPPPPTPDPFYDYVSSDGQLATARVTFATEAAACRLKKTRIVVPFGAKAVSSPRSCSGSLAIDLLFVPAVQGVPKPSLPKSMDEVTDGLELADWATQVLHESVLTQVGGDTTVWRRRIVKLRGSTLVPYSEVTKRSHVEINLAHVVVVEDLNAPASGSRTIVADDDDESVARMDRSFRLVFADGNRIDFFADTDAVKAKWLDVLGQVVGKDDDKKTPPEWAVAVRKLPPPKALKQAA